MSTCQTGEDLTCKNCQTPSWLNDPNPHLIWWGRQARPTFTVEGINYCASGIAWRILSAAASPCILSFPPIMHIMACCYASHNAQWWTSLQGRHTSMTSTQLWIVILFCCVNSSTDHHVTHSMANCIALKSLWYFSCASGKLSKRKEKALYSTSLTEWVNTPPPLAEPAWLWDSVRFSWGTN